MTDILLHINSQQTQEGSVDHMDLTTQGTLTIEEDRYSLQFEGGEPEEEEKVTTKILVEGQRVSMIKTGAIQAHYTFERGKTFSAMYSTPFGSLALQFYPTLVSADMGEDQGRIELEYVLSIEGQQLVNRLNLDYILN